MIQALATAILVLVSIPGGGFADHFARHPNGPYHHALSLAGQYTEAAYRHGIDPHLLIALGYKESAFDSAAVSRARAFGQLQLHPRYHADVLRKCREKPALCDGLVIDRGARVLAFFIRKCRGEAAALHAYRTGDCRVPGPEARKVLAIRRWLVKQTRAT